MGYIASLAKQHPPTQGRALWDRTFGTAKEDPSPQPQRPANGWARSAASEASFKRLLEAMRSNAPGGWTDDRYEQSRHFVGIAYIAGHRKYEQLAQSEFQVYHKDPASPKGKRPVRRDDPPLPGFLVKPYELVRLLERPNHDDSFGDLLYMWGQQMDLTGMGLTWMVPNELSVPYELYPIPTAIAVPQPAISPEYPHGFYRIQPLYPYGPFSQYPTPATSVGAPVPAEWMLRFKFPHPLLRYEGWSPLTALRLHFDEVESIDRSRWYSMKRSVNPSAVLNFEGLEETTPLPQAEIDRIHEEWASNFQGPENAGRLIVGAAGGKIEPWGASPVDMDYQAGWEQLVSFLMAGLGITKPAAGMIEDSSYASLFATLKQLHLLTLKPMADRFAAKLTRQLACFFGDDLIIEIRCPRIDDHEVKEAKLRFLGEGKCLTKNQALDECDMPLTKEPWGNEMWGDPSAAEKQQQQAEAEAAGFGGEGGSPFSSGPEKDKGAAGDMKPANAEMKTAAGDEREVERTRPKTGTLGQGALGPRGKHLGNGHTKALDPLAERLRGVFGNG